MTETNRATPTPPGVTIRPYRPSDHSDCRALWAQLTEHRRRLHHDPQLGGRDAGAGFEEYLTRLDLSGIWVAEHNEEGVVGFLGLILDGRAGDVDPVVVNAAMRGRGIGRALLGRVADEARRRGLARLIVSPAARDAAALHSLHASGFGTLASVTLTLNLRGAMSRAEAGGRTPAPAEPGLVDEFGADAIDDVDSADIEQNSFSLDLHGLRFSV